MGSGFTPGTSPTRSDNSLIILSLWATCPRINSSWARQMAAVQCLDSQGRLYALTGDYGWGGWVVRFTFAPED